MMTLVRVKGGSLVRDKLFNNPLFNFPLSPVKLEVPSEGSEVHSNASAVGLNCLSLV